MTFWNKRQLKLGRHRHLPEDILTEEGEDPPVSGGEQTIRLLGPFPIAWNTVGIEDVPGFKITDLADGTLVLRTWTVSSSDWAGIVNGAFVMCIADTDGTPRLDSEAWGVGANLAVQGGVSLLGSGAANEDYGQLNSIVRRVGGGVTALFVRLVYDSGTLSAGAADVYVLTAEPSA